MTYDAEGMTCDSCGLLDIPEYALSRAVDAAGHVWLACMRCGGGVCAAELANLCQKLDETCGPDPKRRTEFMEALRNSGSTA